MQLAIKTERRHHHQLMTPNRGQGRKDLVFLLLVAAGVVIGVIVAYYVSPVMTQLAEQAGVPA